MDLETKIKRSLDDDSLCELGNKEMKIETPLLNPMVFYQGFQHIVEKIFDQLDKGSLRSCREVSKLWMDSIDNKNLLWKEIIKDVGGDKAFQFACENGHLKMLELLFQTPSEFNIDYNAQDWWDLTAFHKACRNGYTKIAKMLIHKSAEFDIDMNIVDDCLRSAFHQACQNGHLKIVEMLVQKSSEFDIELNLIDINGQTGFHLACKNGHSKIAEMLVQKFAEFKIKLDTKDKNGWTAFHLAQIHGYSEMVRMWVPENVDPEIYGIPSSAK